MSCVVNIHDQSKNSSPNILVSHFYDELLFSDTWNEYLWFLANLSKSHEPNIFIFTFLWRIFTKVPFPHSVRPGHFNVELRPFWTTLRVNRKYYKVLSAFCKSAYVKNVQPFLYLDTRFVYRITSNNSRTPKISEKSIKYL